MFIPHEEMLMVAQGGKKQKDRVHITQVIGRGAVKEPALSRFATPSSASIVAAATNSVVLLSAGALPRALQQQVLLAHIPGNRCRALELSPGLLQPSKFLQQITSYAGQKVIASQRRIAL